MPSETNEDSPMNDDHPSATLAAFAANLRFEDIPAPVMRRAEDLLLDWFGSALAGKTGRPVQAIESFARQMGPSEGKSEVLISRRATTPLFAAMVNAASSHFAEQDDVHNGSVFERGRDAGCVQAHLEHCRRAFRRSFPGSGSLT
jgi:2-methylcitrate dehydratase PrpD